MLLQAEYAKRHDLKIPEVHHTLKSGNLILRIGPDSDLKSRWAVVSSTWKEDTRHPGHYEFRFLKPLHDGNGLRDVWEPVYGYPPDMPLQYEEADEFFREWAASHGEMKAVTGHPELLLAGWEIFLFTHDTMMSNYTASRFREAVEESLDFDASVRARYHAYVRATNHLMCEHPAVLERYELVVHCYARKSLDWLARLVNRGI